MVPEDKGSSPLLDHWEGCTAKRAHVRAALPFLTERVGIVYIDCSDHVLSGLVRVQSLAVGDQVIVPGHRKADPDSHGVLSRIVRMNFPRSVGYFVEVEADNGQKLTTAIGLVRKER